MTLTTRKPTGKPPWPIILIAGAEKAGKSWACAVASSSDLVGRTLWFGMGEDDPDDYANIPGADFDIVEHDGTYRGFLNALMAAVDEPRVDGKPTLIVVDSMTRVWNVLTDMAQETANERARRKGKASDEADISMDLWNTAKQRWAHVMDTLREHDGPVLLTARLDEVTVMQGGKPTTEKALKVQAEKSLPYDVGAVVEMPERGKAYLKGVRSARLQLAERTQWNGFNVDEFWRRLGLDEADATAPRQHPKPAPTTPAPSEGGGETTGAEGLPGEGQPSAPVHPDTDARFKRMQILLRERFGNDRPAALAWVGQQAGRDVASTKDLDAREVVHVVAVLEGRKPEAVTSS